MSTKGAGLTKTGWNKKRQPNCKGPLVRTSPAGKIHKERKRGGVKEPNQEKKKKEEGKKRKKKVWPAKQKGASPKKKEGKRRARKKKQTMKKGAGGGGNLQTSALCGEVVARSGKASGRVKAGNKIGRRGDEGPKGENTPEHNDGKSHFCNREKNFKKGE